MRLDGFTRQLFNIVQGPLDAHRRARRRDELHLAGLRAPVTVDTDEHGVPHVYAEHADDLFFAQGYVTARDRAWQLDYARHAARGRISELVGEKPVPWRVLTVQIKDFTTYDVDVLLRTFGLGAAADASLPLCSLETRRILDAYARGVNAWVATGARTVEHRLLGASMAEWTPADSLVMLKAVGFELSSAWRAQLMGALLLHSGVPADVARALWPSYPTSGPSIVGSRDELRAEHDAAALLSLSNVAREELGMGNAPGLGSNCFAVAGSHSARGDALLANDPHLVIEAPTQWYEIGLHGGGFDLQGFALAGLPGVAIGRTRHHAWGITAALVQDLDIFVERLHPRDPTRYRTPEGWHELDARDECYVVRGLGLRTRRHYASRHGPVLDVRTRPGAGFVYAMAWMGARPSRDLDGMIASWRAGSFAEFRAALAPVTSCPFNLAYADRDGHVGYTLVMGLPKRRLGTPTRPLEGWSGQWDWRGVVPYEEHPFVEDPADGFVVTANQRVGPPDYPHELGGIFEPPERALRIRERLRALGRGVTLEDLQRVQLDVRGLFASRARDLYSALVGGAEGLAGPSPSREARVAAQLWASWDGEATADSPGALIVYATLTSTLRLVVERLAGDEAAHAVLEQPSFTNLPLLRLPAMAARLAELGVDLPAVVREAFAAVVAQYRRELGPSPRRWRWGRVHRLVARHRFHGTPLGALFDLGPFPSPGATDTVNRGDIEGAVSFAHRVGASMRMAVSARDVDRAGTIVPGGQSGDRLSRHYDDQLPLWLRGELKPAPFAEPAHLARREQWSPMGGA